MKEVAKAEVGMVAVMVEVEKVERMVQEETVADVVVATGVAPVVVVMAVEALEEADATAAAGYSPPAVWVATAVAETGVAGEVEEVMVAEVMEVGLAAAAMVAVVMEGSRTVCRSPCNRSRPCTGRSAPRRRTRRRWWR